MDFRDKKSARLSVNQVNSDPRLVWCVHKSAEKKRRSPGEEICHLLGVGITYDPEAAVYGSVLDDLQEHSTSLNLTQPAASLGRGTQLHATKEDEPLPNVPQRAEKFTGNGKRAARKAS